MRPAERPVILASLLAIATSAPAARAADGEADGTPRLVDATFVHEFRLRAPDRAARSSEQYTLFVLQSRTSGSAVTSGGVGTTFRWGGPGRGGVVLGGGGPAVTRLRSEAFAPLCSAPCELRLGTGAVKLAIAKGDADPIPVSGYLNLTEPSVLEGEYHDRSTLRWAGFIGGVAGLATGIALIASAPEDAGPNQVGGTLDEGRFVAGSLIAGLSSVIGFGIFGYLRDGVDLSTRPR